MNKLQDSFINDYCCNKNCSQKGNQLDQSSLYQPQTSIKYALKSTTNLEGAWVHLILEGTF